MGRKKISMNFIEDDRKRASTFDKRRIGLFKKASELNRLCGVSISVIIVNKDLVYKFSDPPHSFYKKINNKPEKIEEDFNNDTLLDFINKKAQKNAYINDSNSIEHHSLEEEQNGTLTDDEEDQRFLDVLDEHHLRDVYNNIDPDISPIKENVDILQIKNLNESDQMNAPGGLMAYNFASNNQNIAQINAPNNSINEMPMEFPSKGHEERITSTKMENVYSELVTVSTTDTSYLYDNTSYSLSNSNWQTYKSHNYSNTNLNFNNANYQNATNYLETPTFETCSNGIILHLPNILHEEDDRPNLKRIKRFNDSIDT